jgi:hypothetical protein
MAFWYFLAELTRPGPERLFSPATAYRLIGEGRLRVKKLGSRTIVEPEELQRLRDGMPEGISPTASAKMASRRAEQRRRKHDQSEPRHD